MQRTTALAAASTMAVCRLHRETWAEHPIVVLCLARSGAPWEVRRRQETEGRCAIPAFVLTGLRDQTPSENANDVNHRVHRFFVSLRFDAVRFRFVDVSERFFVVDRFRVTRSGSRVAPVSRFHSSNVSFEILPSTSSCANFRR